MVKKLNHINSAFYYQQSSLLITTTTSSTTNTSLLHQPLKVTQPSLLTPISLFFLKVLSLFKATLNVVTTMDIAPTTTPTTNTPKSPDPEIETSPQPTSNRIQQPKPLSFTNGVLKRHHPHHHHPLAPPLVISYKECLKNHAASLGGHALDGCGEFMPSPTATPTDPTSLKCAACGCHRNFHRRDPEDSTPHGAATTTATIEYKPHHRHHPPPPPAAAQPNRSPNSASPPPISSSYYPSAPHMLLALSGGIGGGVTDNAVIGGLTGHSARKRFRTKFSQNQKEKMFQFAERVGWKMQKKDEELVQSFCNEVGVDKGVLKVWMHNNKNTFGKRSDGSNGSVRIASNGNGNDHSVIAGGDDRNGNGNENGNNNGDDRHNNHEHHHQFENHHVGHAGTNGSSSSS